MTLNKSYYKKRNGKLEYATLFDTDTQDEKKNESNILDYEKSNKQTSSRLQTIDTQILEYKYIKKGSILIKLHRNQVGMNFRYFYIDDMNYALRWFSPNKKYESSYVKLSDIVSVKKANKKMLNEFGNGMYIDNRIYQLSLKIKYLNNAKKPAYLYIVCKNKLEQKLWLCGLGHLINDQYNTKYYFENYIEYLNDDIYQYLDVCSIFFHNYFENGVKHFNKYVQQQLNKIQKQEKKLENIEYIKDMDDEIKQYIIPLSKKISETLSTICSFVNNINRYAKYEKITKTEKKNITILLFQNEIKYQIIEDILKVLSKKYKKQIKQKKQKINFENHY